MGQLVESKQSKITKLLDECNIPQDMLGDAFVALLVSLMSEMFLSSDSKYFIIQGLLSNLEKMGYTDEAQMQQFTNGLNELMKKSFHKNNFMG